jgi:hypothetical protein
VRQDGVDQQRVQRLESSLKRLAQRRDLRPHPALGKIGEDRRVGRPRYERVEHRAARPAKDVGGDAVELDAGVLERLVQPVRLPLTL